MQITSPAFRKGRDGVTSPVYRHSNLASGKERQKLIDDRKLAKRLDDEVKRMNELAKQNVLGDPKRPIS